MCSQEFQLLANNGDKVLLTGDPLLFSRKGSQLTPKNAVTTGVLISRMDIGEYGADGVSRGTILGYRISLLKSVKVFGIIGIATGFIFTGEGFEYYQVYGRGIETTRMNFLKIPVFLTRHESKRRFNLLLGPYIAARLGNESKSDIMDTHFFSTRKTGLGVDVGLRYTITRLGRGSLFAVLHGDLGLTTFRAEDDSYYKSLNLSVSLGYLF